MKSRWFLLAGLLVLVGVLVAGCGGGGSKSSESEKEGGGAKTKVTLQLKWVTQAQFAGYYAAKAKGYYDEEGLDVNLKVGGPSITPEQVVLGKQAEFGIDWLPSLLSSRDKGQDLVNIAQVFTRSGMTRLQTMRRIVLPQAMRVIIPPTGNEMISMLKTSSLASVIAVTELLYTVQLIYAVNYETIPLLLVASIWYLMVTTVLSVGQYYVERYYGRGATRDLPETPVQRLRRSFQLRHEWT